MPGRTPLVSIIVPTYNRAGSITATIQSVLEQEYKNWELIIVDDGSSDDTAIVVDRIKSGHPAVFFTATGTQHKGGNYCRNLGLQKAKGEYLLFLDSDDLLLPFCLSNRVRIMTEEPGFDFYVFPGTVFETDPDQPSFYWNIETNIIDLKRFLFFYGPWQTSGATWKRSFLAKEQLQWDEQLFIWQDIDFHARALLARPGYKIYWEEDYDYLVCSGSADSVSRQNYFSDEKIASRIFFLNKYINLLHTHERLKAGWLKPLLLIVLRSFIVKKNNTGSVSILEAAVRSGIISGKEAILIKRGTWMHRISFGRIKFPSAKLQRQLFSYEPTLQRIHV
jgi:glycosyltransferase involved in cell wall biosynthesis